MAPAPSTPIARTAPAPFLRTLAVLAVVAAVGYVTLGPSGTVAGARSAVVAAVETLLGGSVRRGPVEAAANVLLFLPVGAVATVVLARRSRLLPLLLGVGLSGVLELTQSVLPGRVPDLADVAANAAGTALGVGLVSAVLAGGHRVRAGLLAVPLLVVLTACSTGGSPVGAPDGTAGQRMPVVIPDDGVLTAEDGWLPDGESLAPFADVPAITQLDPALRTAVQDAARAAAADGVDLRLTSGWRSEALQRALFDAAVSEYGSEDAARQHVLPPDLSAHVTGDAVDIGPTDAMSWLSQHGADHGLCQTYANELWHYELAVEPGGECPAAATDPSAG